MSHDMFQFRPDAKDYDNALLKKLDSRRGLDSPSPMRRSSALSSSMQDPIGPRNYERLHTQLKPLSLPIQTRTAPSLVDSPSRWSETPLSSAASPRSALSTAPPYYRSAASDLSSMSGTMDYERSPPAPATNGLPLRTRRRTDSVSVAATDDDTNTLASSDVHDVRMEDADDVESGASQQMRRLEISDHHTSPYGHHHYQPSTPYANSAGQKRRASSPALDEQQQHALLHQGPPPLPHLNTSTEGLNHHYQQQQHHGNSNHHRRGSRVSPTPRSAVHLHSARSYASGASSSLSSASASEPSPFGRRSSPGSGQSPGAMSPMASSAVTDVGSPYATPVSAVSPRAAVMSGIRTVHESSRRRQPQQVSSPREMDNGPAVVSTKVGSSKISGMGILMCECCPKKPKRFETQEELR